MATSAAPTGSVPVAQTQATSTESLESQFALGVWHLLSTWPPLTLAIQNHWGGEASSDKRDWLAAELASLFTTRPETDAYDIEDMLLQVMQDEFDLNVEDETEGRVAREIVGLRKEVVEEGRVERVVEWQRRWVERKGREVETKGLHVHDAGEHIEEVDSDEDEDDGDNRMDVEMSDASAAPQRERAPPEVDEDGFTKVVGKRNR